MDVKIFLDGPFYFVYRGESVGPFPDKLTECVTLQDSSLVYLNMMLEMSPAS